MKPKSYRDEKTGKFAKFPLGSVVLLLDDKSYSMSQSYFIVIAVKNGWVATIPYSHEPTKLHAHNVKVSNLQKLEIVKRLSPSDITNLITQIKVAILESKPYDAYIGVARHAISQLELITKL